jgi:predicted acyltransferase
VVRIAICEPRHFILTFQAKYFAAKLRSVREIVEQSNTSGASATMSSAQSQRLLSLDVLRGLTVALMILVNNAGGSNIAYAQLRHSAWNGCTVTDCVFPGFLFMVGGSIALSFRRRLSQQMTRGAILLQVLKRAVLIFIIGLLLNALPFFQLSDLRYYGVLQRIAICYALASIVYLFGGLVASSVVAAIALVGYWWLMLHVRVPGYGLPGVDVGVLDPAGNLAAWLDRLLVPTAHMYRHTVYDPEGMLSTLPALASTLIGAIAVSVLQTTRTTWHKVSALLSGGAILIAAGLIWSHWFPLNKRVWTSSFVLFTAGISVALLGLFFLMIDGPLKIRSGLTPWLVFGTNALGAYIFSEVLAIVLGAINLSHGETLQQFLFRLLPHTLGPPPLLSAVYSVLFVIVCFLPVMYLYRDRIFLKI